MWLWAVLWPAEAGYVLLEHVVLHDLRERVPADLVVGAPVAVPRPPPAGAVLIRRGGSRIAGMSGTTEEPWFRLGTYRRLAVTDGDVRRRHAVRRS